MRKALEIVKSFDTEAERSQGLVALAPNLPPELIPEAIELAEGIKKEDLRFHALVALRVTLPLKALAPYLALAKVTP